MFPSFFHSGVILLITIYVGQLHAQQTWTQVPITDPSPTRNLLRGISGTSAEDIWVVGNYQPGETGQDNQIQHWNGSGWTQFTTENLSFSSFSDLNDVAAIAADNAWAVGSYDGVSIQPQLLHWNGTSWEFQNIPDQPFSSSLNSIDAISASDIWAAGFQAGIGPDSCYVLHFNGSSWNKIDVPPVGTMDNEFVAIDAVNENDVWAVGTWRDVAGSYRYLAMHWNGDSWTNTPMPASLAGIGDLWDVSVISSDDVWAVGDDITGGIVVIHWNGSEWSEVNSPYGAAAIATLAPDHIYGVGSDIIHWNGNAFSIVDPLDQHQAPALHATVVLPDGEVWAAGRNIDSEGVFRNLVYRSNTTFPVGMTSWVADEDQLIVGPNPFCDRFFVQFPTMGDQEFTITIYDQLGRYLESHPLPQATAGQNSIEIQPASDLVSGSYWIILSDGRTRYRTQVIHE